MKKVLSIVMMAALLVAAVPAAGGNAYAAKKPARVKSVSLSQVSHTALKVKWSKVKKGLAGYTIYRNGKAVKNVGKSTTSFTDTGLVPSTKYTYYVKAYTNAKVKQWYNKKTGKWQTKKPAKKIRGKSRTVKKKLYGKASKAISCKTMAAPSPTSSGKAEMSLKSTYNSVSLTWTSVSGARYKVYRNGTLVAETTSTSFTDKGLSASTTYSYILEIIKGSDVVIELSETITTSSKPKVTLNWTRETSAVKYMVYRDDTLIKDNISASTTSYTDDTVTPGQTYTYAIKCVKEGEDTPLLIYSETVIAG